jgi:hypothetical protein
MWQTTKKSNRRYRLRESKNSAFCREIYRVLGDYCGNAIHEIDHIDMSYAPNGAGDRRQVVMLFGIFTED